MLERFKELDSNAKKNLLFYLVVGIAIVCFAIHNLFSVSGILNIIVALLMLVAGIIVIGVGLLDLVK